MAKHSSFKTILAYETYQNFFATVRAQKRAHEDPAWDLGDPSGTPGNSQPAACAADMYAEPTLPFISVEVPIRPPKFESWIESWLSGKTSGPAA